MVTLEGIFLSKVGVLALLKGKYLIYICLIHTFQDNNKRLLAVYRSFIQ